MLSSRAGFEVLAPFMAAAEFNRPYKGLTEEAIKETFHRGLRLPHLATVVVIDEIDSIAPNRMSGKNGATEHKVEALSALLTVFGGVADVENVVVIGATNRFNDMEPAFLRRMHSKLFVGLQPPSARLDMLHSVGHDLAFEGDAVACRNMIVELTTNFSGDNMRKIISVLAIACRRCNGPVTASMITKSVETFALMENILIGGSPLTVAFCHWLEYEQLLRSKHLIPVLALHARVFGAYARSRAAMDIPAGAMIKSGPPTGHMCAYMLQEASALIIRQQGVGARKHEVLDVEYGLSDPAGPLRPTYAAYMGLMGKFAVTNELNWLEVRQSLAPGEV
jgi:hypothetical protein